MKSSFTDYSVQSYNKTASTGHTGGYVMNNAWHVENLFSKSTGIMDNEGAYTYSREEDNGTDGRATYYEEGDYFSTSKYTSIVDQKYISVGTGFENESLEDLDDIYETASSTQNTFTIQVITTTNQGSEWRSSTSSWETNKDENGSFLFSSYITTESYQSTTRTRISTESYNHTFSYSYMTYAQAQGVFNTTTESTYNTALTGNHGTIVPEEGSYLRVPDVVPVSNGIYSLFRSIVYSITQEGTFIKPFGQATITTTWNDAVTEAWDSDRYQTSDPKHTTSDINIPSFQYLTHYNSLHDYLNVDLDPPSSLDTNTDTPPTPLGTRAGGQTRFVPITQSERVNLYYPFTMSEHTYTLLDYDKTTGQTSVLHGANMETYTFNTTGTTISAELAATYGQKSQHVALSKKSTASTTTSTRKELVYHSGVSQESVNGSVITFRIPKETKARSYSMEVLSGGQKWQSSQTHSYSYTVRDDNDDERSITINAVNSGETERPDYGYTSDHTGLSDYSYSYNVFGITGVIQRPRWAWQSSKGSSVDHAEIGSDYDASHFVTTQTLFANHYGADFGGYSKQNDMYMSSYVNRTRCEARIPYSTEVQSVSESLYTIDDTPYTAYVDYWTTLDKTTHFIMESLIESTTASSTTYDGGTWSMGQWSVISKDMFSGKYLFDMTSANRVVIGVSSISGQPTSSCYVHGVYSVKDTSTEESTKAYTYWAGDYWDEYTTTGRQTITNLSYKWERNGEKSSYLPSTISYNQSYNNTQRMSVDGVLPYSYMGGRDYKGDPISYLVAPYDMECEIETASCTDTSTGLSWAGMTLYGTTMFYGDDATYIREKPKYTKTSIYDRTTFYQSELDGWWFVETAQTELSMQSRSCGIDYDTIFRPPYETSDYQEGMRIGDSVVTDGELVHYTEYE